MTTKNTAGKNNKSPKAKVSKNQLKGSEISGRTPPPELGQGDACLRMSRLSDGKVSSQQVRVLVALAWVTKSPHTDSAGRLAITRSDLKELVGIGRDSLYSQSWLADLWELTKKSKDQPAPLVNIEEDDSTGRPRHIHSITAAGRKLVEKLTKAHKETTD